MATRGRPDEPGAHLGGTGRDGATRRVGRAPGAGRGRQIGTAVRAGGRGLRRSSRVVARRVRRATHAEGAGASGLGPLIELNAVSAVADALVAVALAGTLFFAVPVGEARGRVTLYLLVTLAPFVVLAPLVGPLLDRLRGDRRWAMLATFVVRAVLAAGLVDAAASGALRAYPLAFAVLVASKAFAVTRQSAVPRLLPPGLGLVRANSRISLAGILAASAVAPLGVGLAALLGPGTVLWGAAAAAGTGAVLAARLPDRADAMPGEHPRPAPRRTTLRRLGPRVGLALRGNLALRTFSGFLTFFLAFLLREVLTGGRGGLVLVIAAAAAGGLAGTSAGALLWHRAPEAVLPPLLALVAAVTLVAGAAAAGLALVAVVAGAAGAAQALGKLALDAVVQQETPEMVRSSVFTRTETLLQLAWVVGAAAGTLFPLHAVPAPGRTGLLLAGAGLVAALVVALRDRARMATRRLPRAQAG